MDHCQLLREFPVYLERHCLASSRHLPFIRRWVERFLAGTYQPGLAWDDRLRVFIDSFQQWPGIANWQVRQTEEAVRLFRLFAGIARRHCPPRASPTVRIGIQPAEKPGVAAKERKERRAEMPGFNATAFL